MSQQINLYNAALFKKKELFSATMIVVSALVILLLSGLVAAYASYQTKALKASADIVSQQLHAAEAQVAALRATAVIPEKNKALLADIVKLQEQIAGHQQIAASLQKSDFGNTQGYSAYLVAFARQAPAGLWLTGFSIASGGQQLGLQGRTLKPELLPNYVNALTRESIMRGKSFSSLQMQLPASDDKDPAQTQAKQDKKAAPNYLEFDLRTITAQEKAEGTQP